MIEIRETDEYAGWFEGLRDLNARMRIGVRIRRVSLGNFGDTKSVGGGVSELRIPTVRATESTSPVAATRS